MDINIEYYISIILTYILLINIRTINQKIYCITFLIVMILISIASYKIYIKNKNIENKNKTILKFIQYKINKFTKNASIFMHSVMMERFRRQ